MSDAKLVYLDASAFVKLVIPEPETEALIAALAPAARMVASEILEVQAIRAARGPPDEQLRTCAPTTDATPWPTRECNRDVAWLGSWS